MNKNSKEIRKVPNLRFLGFEGEWIKKPLGKISRMKAGKFVRANDIFEEINDGLYPCYGGNGLRGYTSSFTHYGKYSLIGRQGALCGNVNLVNGRFHATEHAVVVDHNDEINTDFLFYVLNNLNLNRYATGQAQPGLSVSSIERITFSFPLLPEQQKIADFLTAVDERIQTQNKIIQHLESLIKGFSQKLFSQQIRFKDENGNDFSEWETKKMDSFLSIPIKETPKEINTSKIISVKLHLKGIHVNERTESLKIGATKYIIRKKGQFIYGKQNLFNGAFGIIPEELDGCLSSGDIPSLNINRNLINSKFLYFYLGRKSFYKGLEKLASGSGSKRIHEKTLLKLKITIPSIEEQTKIANFLSSLDAKLEKEKQLLEQYQQQKKYLLQNLFI